jgi:hypothetical protein
MHCNNNFIGKQWTIFDPKLYGPRGDPGYHGPDHRRPDYWMIAALRSVRTARSRNEFGWQLPPALIVSYSKTRKFFFFFRPSPLLPYSTHIQTFSNTWNVTKGHWVQWILRPHGRIWKRLSRSNGWWLVAKLFPKNKVVVHVLLAEHMACIAMEELSQSNSGR